MTVTDAIAADFDKAAVPRPGQDIADIYYIVNSCNVYIFQFN